MGLCLRCALPLLSWLALLTTAVPIADVPTVAPKRCTSTIDVHVGEECLIRWELFRQIARPTQAVLGHALVLAKHKDYADPEKLHQSMKSAVPVVLGPQGVPFVVDHHHRLAALDLLRDGVGVDVLVQVSCDLSHLDWSLFWNEMESRRLVLRVGTVTGSDEFRTISSGDLPDRFHFSRQGTLFQNSPWRSLATFVHLQGRHSCATPSGCQVAYHTNCTQDGKFAPFAEFSWAYFMQSAYHNQTMWGNNTQDWLNFQNAFQNLIHTGDVDSFDEKPWLAAAEPLLALCHLSVAETFQIPQTIPDIAGPLLGFTAERYAQYTPPVCNNVLC